MKSNHAPTISGVITEESHRRRATPLGLWTALRGVMRLSLLCFTFFATGLSAQPVTNCTATPAGLAGWWPGDLHGYDVVGGRFAVLNNGEGYGPGLVGPAFTFGGGQQRVRILESTTTDLSRLPRWTIEAWVYPASFVNAAYPTIYSEGNRIVSLGINNGTGRLESWVNNDSSKRLIGANALTSNDWNHVALVFDGTRRFLYLNGTLSGSTNTAAIIDDDSGATIGQVTQADSNSPLVGSVDEVSLYNRALSALEISVLAASRAGKCFTNAPAPAFALLPTNRTAYLGESITLVGIAMGSPRPEYQWEFNGAALRNETNATLTLPSVNFSHDGDYRLVARNPVGSDSATARVSVPWCATSPSSIRAWWPADGSGLDAVERHDGAIWGGTTFGPGIAGSGFRFNGLSSYVAIPDAPELSPHAGTNGEMSLEAWIKLDELPQPDSVTRQNFRSIMSKGDPGQWEYSLGIDTAGVPSFTLWNLNASAATSLAGGQIVTGQWHHVVATLKKGETARLYQDGRLVGTTNLLTESSDSKAPLYLGRRSDGQFLNGWVDEVAIYNRALTPDNVSALHLAESAGKCSGATNPAPFFVRQPDNQTGYLLLGAGLTSFAVGSPRPAYQWYQSNATEWLVVTGATQGSLVLSNLSVNAEGNYRVMASNAHGVTLSESAFLKVIPHDILRDGEHFEKGWNGWETDGSIWQVGNQAGQTNGIAATILDGNYPWLAASRLQSPMIELPTVSGDEQLVLRFWHWFDYYSGYWNDGYNSGDGGNDFGQIQVQSLNTNTLQWSTWSNLQTIRRYSAGWSPAQVDLSAYSGKRVRIGFYHADLSEDSDPYRGLQHFEGRGWHLDDVSITVRQIEDFANVSGFENGWDGWYAENGVWAVGTGGAHSGSNYMATVTGAAYPWLTASRLVSPIVQVPVKSSSEEVVFGFWHSFNYYSGYWNDGYNSGDGGNDYGQVQVQSLNPVTRQWSSWTSLLTIKRVSAGWSPAQIDLSSYAGKSIRIGFYHTDASEDSDPYRGLMHYEAKGWLLDDISIAVRRIERPTQPEGFENGWNGWHADNGVWAVGTGGGHSGSNYIATSPGTAYPWLTTSRLVSPTIEVPSLMVGEEVVLRFWQWFNYYSGYWNDGYNSGDGGNDFGQVQVQSFDSNTGQWSAWAGLLTVRRYSAGWSPAQIDLSSYAGKTIRIGFYHSDASEDNDPYRGLQHYESSGWQLDDFSVSVRPVQKLIDPEGFEDGWSSWYAENGVWAVGIGGGHSGSNHIATVPGAAYPWLTTSRLVSPVIEVPSVGPGIDVAFKFWHWFNYYSGYWSDGYNSGDGGNDIGQVQVQSFDTNTLQWSGWNAALTVSRISTAWAATNISLSAYAGKKIRVGFYHADASEDTDPYRGLQHYQSTGWHIDDVFIKRGNLAIASIADQTVNELATLTFPVSVFGTTPESCLSYRLIDPPDGASINPITGVFRWTPSECQGPGVYTIGIYVVDFCGNEANDLGFVRVTVNEVNQAPWLGATEETVYVGRTNSVSLCSGDFDCPRNPLSYTSLSPLPAGASLDSGTGLLRWAPTLAQTGTHNIRIRLCDGGSPNQCVTNSVTLGVTTNEYTLEIQQIQPDRTRFMVRGASLGVDYVLEGATELCGCPCQTAWQEVSRVTPTVMPYTIELRMDRPHLFFRLREMPRNP